MFAETIAVPEAADTGRCRHAVTEWMVAVGLAWLNCPGRAEDIGNKNV